MLVNMSSRNNRQMNISTNNISGIFASFKGRTASVGMFAHKNSYYSSPTSVAGLTP
jgi:hypothetical protein